MKKNIKDKFILYALSLASVLSLSGCSSEIDCSIEDSHIHLYVSDKGYQTYCNSENEFIYIDGIRYYRKDNMRYSSVLENKFYKFLHNKDLISLSDYYDHFISRYPKNEDYLLYEYKYTVRETEYYTDSEGNRKSRTVTKTKRAWTKDANHSRLTGNTRLMATAYKGYRVYYNESTREFECIESGYYDTIEELYNAGFDFVCSESMCVEVERKDIVVSKEMYLNR